VDTLARNDEKEKIEKLHNQVSELLEVIDSFCETCHAGNDVLFRLYNAEREMFIRARKEFIKNKKEFVARHSPQQGIF